MATSTTTAVSVAAVAAGADVAPPSASGPLSSSDGRADGGRDACNGGGAAAMRPRPVQVQLSTCPRCEHVSMHRPVGSVWAPASAASYGPAPGRRRSRPCDAANQRGSVRASHYRQCGREGGSVRLRSNAAGTPDAHTRPPHPRIAEAASPRVSPRRPAGTAWRCARTCSASCRRLLAVRVVPGPPTDSGDCPGPPGPDTDTSPAARDAGKCTWMYSSSTDSDTWDSASNDSLMYECEATVETVSSWGTSAASSSAAAS